MTVVYSLWRGEQQSVGAPTLAGSTMRDIAALVAAEYGLTVDELKGPSRARRLAWPRQEAYWRCRQIRRADGLPRYSMPMIAAYFGHRDHTTVLHGIRAHAARMCGEGAE